MDGESFSLLRRLAAGQLARVTAAIEAIAEDERGSTYVRFVKLHLEAIDRLATEAEVDYAAATLDAEREIYGRRLQRLHLMLDAIHGDVFNYRRDVGRRDLPVGLLYLIDALIDDLLKASADPLVHSDTAYMYSTVRLKTLWRRLSSALGIAWAEPTEPVIFNLPGLDPANAMLSPILAHEVGHSVLQRSDLVADVEARLDPAVVASLRAQLAADDPGADEAALLAQFVRWLEELVCDALATELCGASMLFASAAFLPASSAGGFGDEHPDPASRLTLTLRQLDDTGWSPALSRHCPNTLAWLQAVAAKTPATTAPPSEVFLRELVALAIPAIIEVARGYVGSSFEGPTFEAHEAELMALIAHGVPPAEIQGMSISPWTIVVSCWFHGISSLGDSPSGIASIPSDAGLSKFALKAVEMSRVLQLWTSP